MAAHTLWVGDASPSLGDMTKTGQENLNKELLDHWLTNPGNNTLQRAPALVVSLQQQQLLLFSGNKPGSRHKCELWAHSPGCPWSMRLVIGVTVFLTLGKCSVSTRDDFEAKEPWRVICSLLPTLCFSQHCSNGIENRCMHLLGSTNFHMTG